MAKQTYTAGQVLTASSMSALQANDYNQTVSTKTASYVLVAADVGTRIVMNSTTDATITVNASLFAAGDTLWIHDIGAGNCTIVAGTCTVTTSSSLVIPTNGGGYLYFTSASSAIFFATGNINQTQSLSNRNILINGGFSVWQRGTSGAGYVSSGGFVADRWQGIRGAAAAGMTMYQITGTSTEIPNNQFMMRLQRDSGNTSTQDIRLFYSAETLDSMSLVGQPVTISFYVRKGSNYSGGDVTATVYSGTGTDQNLGISGFTGSTAVATATRTSATLTTGFTRVSGTGTVATSAKQLGLIISYTPTGTAGANDFIDIWGIQLEAGAVATPFEFEAYGTTLAKCQRYYFRSGAAGGITVASYTAHGYGYTESATGAVIYMFPPVALRSPSTMTLQTSNVSVADSANNFFTPSGYALNGQSPFGGPVEVLAVIAGATANRPARLCNTNNTSGFIALSSEL